MQVGGGERPGRQFRWGSAFTHAEGFPLVLNDAASSYWLDLKNEQCAAQRTITCYITLRLMLLIIQLLTHLTHFMFACEVMCVKPLVLCNFAEYYKIIV